MNSQARSSIHQSCETLRAAEQSLKDAASAVQDQNTKNSINNQLNTVTQCLNECEKIASGLSQYLYEKKYEGIHH